MKFLFSMIFFVLGCSLTSCLEIIDDISIRSDGSGNLKYTVNLSSSKSKVNSYLALDSLDGKKVPSKEEIRTRVDELVAEFRNQEGISNVSLESDYTNFMFKLSLSFDSLESLKKAVKRVVEQEGKGQDLEEWNLSWLVFEDNRLVRSIPNIEIKKAQELKPDEIAKLKTGKYTSITRFDRQIDHCKNKASMLSKNKKAVMLRTNPYALLQNLSLLDNEVHLVKMQENK